MSLETTPDLPDDRRRCRSCGADMAATGRRDAPWHRPYVYTCPDCGYACDLDDAASLGSWTTTILIACGMLGAFAWSMRWRDTFDDIVFFGLIAAMLSFLGHRWWKHVTHPATQSGSEIPASNFADILIGLARPIILIAAVLGVAALIGLATFDW